MIDRATAAAWLKAVEGDELDKVLAEKGFGRAARSAGYSRKVADGRQFLMSPNAGKDALPACGRAGKASFPARRGEERRACEVAHG